MARSPGGLSLEGFLRIASKKWRRFLTVKRGGAPGRGLVELHLTGSAPGGFAVQIMQVSIFDLARWCLAVLKWIGANAAWAVTQEQIAEAKRIIDTLE